MSKRIFYDEIWLLQKTSCSDVASHYRLPTVTKETCDGHTGNHHKIYSMMHFSCDGSKPLLKSFCEFANFLWRIYTSKNMK